MLRTYQPKKRHEYLRFMALEKRMSTKNGRKVLARRSAQGQKEPVCLMKK